MATNRPTSSSRLRPGYTESSAYMWEKTYERVPQTKQDAPFGNDENNDALEENPVNDDSEGYETDPEPDESQNNQSSSLPLSKRRSASLNTLNIDEPLKPWENQTEQDYLIIVLKNDKDIEESKQRLQHDFSRRGLKWTNEEEEIRLWHFGLTAIHLHFDRLLTIDIRTLSSSRSTPFWLTLKKEKKEKQQNILNNNISNQHIRYSSEFDISLHYGALTDLDQFHYSPQHSWTNGKDPRWSLSVVDKRNGDGHIEWIIQNAELRRKKQLLATNIDHSAIVDVSSDGFDIYICQKCNMNEFEATSNKNDNSSHRNRHKNYPNRDRDSKHFTQRTQNNRTNSHPRAPPPLRSVHSDPLFKQRISYTYYRRIGITAGCYFPTIQFSLRINSSPLTNNDPRNLQNQKKRTLSLLIEFFLAHKVTVCYGKINSQMGPDPYLFFQPNMPKFQSLIMTYSWQMLSSVGYRLQNQIDDNFCRSLIQLSKEPNNADELFYRVCVYLSRIFSLKPFIDINTELEHAVTESKRKRNESSYGLVRKLDTEEENEAYIPSVTLTPTTIRIKPLKLCRTNRVLRATDKFGEPLYHFILVDIRDENGRDLQSFHFRDLRSTLLKYLEVGFTLMGDGRQYEYLHHSQSQLRERQFWFYHHNCNDNPENMSSSFAEAYDWMGSFDHERNPAKNAARMALCFSTTKGTVEVPREKVLRVEDIMTKDGHFTFTDGCGTMSIALRNKIQRSLRIRNDFSAVQFRYGGAKGVVSVDPRMNGPIDLHIRPSMTKFESDHQRFEVCKVSAPRPLYLNRQAILLLSYRKISDVSFLILQQQYHLALIRALLRNDDAEKLILEKVPRWFLPRDIHEANIDFIHEPFFRQLLISACLQSTRDLLKRTRIRIPRNQGRNMIGIVDEYNVLESNQVFIQYTIMDTNPNEENNKRTETLDNCKVVITKNPCHHPGDIRTFTAVDHPSLAHLKDVVVFSQQGKRPAPHQISGSDLDGDEYLVIWNEDLVPNTTGNAQPYDYDAQTPAREFDKPVTRNAINNIVLEIAEQDCLGRLSNLHLAFADKFGVDDNERSAEDVFSTIELAGAISQEVDSGKTGFHPLNEAQIKNLNNVLGNERPDYMDNPNYKPKKSNKILGKLFRASKRTLPGWNRLLRYHRHLRHLQVRTRDESEESEEDEEEVTDNEDEGSDNLDRSLLVDVNREHPAYTACVTFARDLVSVYRQEIFEILSLYGLSHESDLWCRNSINGISGELEDTAYTELEQLVTRTRTRFYNEQVSHDNTECRCNDDTPFRDLCPDCKIRQRSLAVACYCVSYGGENATEQAPILSLPWLFATPLLQGRLNETSSRSNGLLSTAMKKALDHLIFSRHRLILMSTTLTFRTSKDAIAGEATVNETVCVFIEVLQEWIGRNNYPRWPFILIQFIQKISSSSLLLNQLHPSDQLQLVLEPHTVDDEDFYAATLVSMTWSETEDELMHNYFDKILKICFDEGRRTDDINILEISENIILLLQKMAIKETIF